MTASPQTPADGNEGRYRRWPLIRDFAIGGGGGGASMVFGSLPDLATWVAVIFWTLAAIFAGFVAITAVRAASRVAADAEGIRIAGPINRLILWSDLKSLNLKYYSTKRDGQDGCYQLLLTDGVRTIKVTSDLQGFEGIVVRSVRAARRQGAGLDPTTLANLAEIGVANAAMADEGEDRGQ